MNYDDSPYYYEDAYDRYMYGRLQMEQYLNESEEGRFIQSIVNLVHHLIERESSEPLFGGSDGVYYRMLQLAGDLRDARDRRKSNS